MFPLCLVVIKMIGIFVMMMMMEVLDKERAKVEAICFTKRLHKCYPL